VYLIHAPVAVLAVLYSLWPAPAQAQTQADESEAELILHSGRIYTMNAIAPWAEAVAILDGRFLYVGDSAGAEAFAGPGTRREDLGGQFVLPGLIDSHIHIGNSLPFLFAAKLSPAMTPGEVLDAMRTHAEAFPSQNPVLGKGFLGASFGPLGPTAEMLDEAVPDRAAILIDEGSHTAWINSVTMAQVGLDADTQDPVPGAHYYRRYPDGRPTGWLIESESFNWIFDALGVISPGSLSAAADEFFAIMLSKGITAAFDAGITRGQEPTMEFFDRRVAAGEVPVRIVASHYVNNPRQLKSALSDLATLDARFDDEFYDLRVLKLSLDGTVEALTAYMLEPYRDPPGHLAQPLVPIGATSDVVLAAARKDIDVHMHAIGDAAVRMALDMVQRVREEAPASDSRFTVCHVQVVHPTDRARFGELDVIAQSTPTWYAYDDVALAYLGAERLQHFYPLRSIAEGGARVTLGSDYPASWIGLDGLAPMFNIEMAITRQPAGDQDFLPQPPATERISLQRALRGYTLDAAYQLRLENEIGSIEPGKRADFVVLERNLFDIAHYEIHDVKVSSTYVGGKAVYRLGSPPGR
jgi:predicted amidohydrolase YtcJ